MAQTIKHRRGKLESIASITPINGELIIASGSDLSVHQEGLLFVGVEGNVLTPSNKILTGSATAPDVTGGSFDHSVDGIPYYDTDDKKLFILGHGGNTNVTFTTNSLDLLGSGIVSSSTQVSELAGINDSTVTITAGDGLKTGGTFTTNQSGNSSVTLDIDVSDFAGTGLEADGSENLRLASQGNGIAGGGGSTLSVDLDGSTLSLSSDGLKAGDAILNTSLNTFTGSNANDRLNAFTGSTNLTIAGNSVSINGGSVTAANILKGTGVVSGSAQIDGSALGSNKTITIGGSSVTLGGTLSNSALLEEVVGGTGIQSGSGDIAGVTAFTESVADAFFSPAGFTRGQIRGAVKLAFNPNQSQRDELYKARINPVVSFPGQGTVLFGDKTAQAKPSAFDRINVRRLFITLEKTISIAAKFQLFEFNDEFTRAQFRNLIEPFLRDVQGRRGVTDFSVVCDDTNNTGDVIDRNEFRADIFVKPARSINFIQLNFVATRSGVAFSEVAGA